MIFSALFSVFGMMMSNTRLSEQNHEALRHSLQDNVPLAFTDAQREYLVNDDYYSKQERQIDKARTKTNDRQRKQPHKGVPHEATKVQQKRWWLSC